MVLLSLMNPLPFLIDNTFSIDSDKYIRFLDLKLHLLLCSTPSFDLFETQVCSLEEATKSTSFLIFIFVLFF